MVHNTFSATSHELSNPNSP